MRLYRFTASGSRLKPAPLTLSFQADEPAFLHGGIMLERWIELGAARQVVVEQEQVDGRFAVRGIWTFDDQARPQWTELAEGAQPASERGPAGGG